MRLKREFFIQPTLKVAQELLGKYIVRRINRKTLAGRPRRRASTLRGRIVETEAYIGPKDKASHSFGGKVTSRNKIEYLKGGYCYIYLVYGMYWQFNVTTEKKNKPECVLIRALEPVNGLLELKNLTNGPGKLCRWLKLDKSFYGEDLTQSRRLWLEDRSDKLSEKVKKSQIVKAKRIGIDYAKEYSLKPWRFYIKDNIFVSKKEKKPGIYF